MGIKVIKGLWRFFRMYGFALFALFWVVFGAVTFVIWSDPWANVLEWVYNHVLYDEVQS